MKSRIRVRKEENAPKAGMHRGGLSGRAIDVDRGPVYSGGPKTLRGENINFFQQGDSSNGRKDADNHRRPPIHGYRKRKTIKIARLQFCKHGE